MNAPAKPNATVVERSRDRANRYTGTAPAAMTAACDQNRIHAPGANQYNGTRVNKMNDE